MRQTEEQREEDAMRARRSLFEPRTSADAGGVIAAPPLPPRRAHVQMTQARSRQQPGGDLGTIAWPEHVDACHARGFDPERTQAAGGLDYAAVCLLLGREPKTWERRV